MDLLVSVIVPVFKIEESYLRNSIDSILKQTYQNLEIILVDDGSPDNCGFICEEYASLDNRVKVYHLPNSGVSVARNFGLAHCKGAYIMFVDSDDYIARHYIEIMLKTCIEYKVDCVCSKCKYVDSVLREECISARYNIELFTKNESMEELCYLKRVTSGLEMGAVWGTLYSRQMLNGVKFDEHVIIGEDFLFKYFAFKKIDKVVFLHYAGYYYLQRLSSAMHSAFNKKKLNILSILQKYISETDQNKEIGFISRSVNIAFSILFIIPITDEFKSEREIVIRFIKKYRWIVLVKSKAKLKVKGACFLSVFGFKFTQYLFMYLIKYIRGDYQ